MRRKSSRLFDAFKIMMTSTSASPPRLVVVAPVDRKFTNAGDWSPRSSPPPLLTTCSISNISPTFNKPESSSPLPTCSSLLHSNTNTNNGRTVDDILANGLGSSRVLDVGVNNNDQNRNDDVENSLKTNCNKVDRSPPTLAVYDAAAVAKSGDSDDIDVDDDRLIINENDIGGEDRNVIEPLIIAKRKKSKRRRWILSRKPKCISRTQRIIYPSKQTNSNSKRKLLTNGLDDEASDDQDLSPLGQSAVVPSSTNHLEPLVHGSVFLPRKCQLHSNNDDDDNEEDIDSSSPCLQTNLMKTLLPHLHTVLSADLDDVFDWSLDEVARFIRTIPVYGGNAASEKLADKFKDELIDGEALLLLTQNDLIKQMNIKLGPALKIYSSIVCIKHERSKRKGVKKLFKKQ